ncbi:MAG: rhodanese-like domain-containing protein [Pseudomonadota bacterium]
MSEIGPKEAWELLGADPAARLVDVRTRAEWSFVGLPDLGETGKRAWTVEWVGFPAMTPNQAFLSELSQFAAADGGMPETLLFICRSGARSLAAARLVAEEIEGVEHCINVAEGFEGDLDGDGHRGSVNGWKVAGLPWRQG